MFKKSCKHNYKVVKQIEYSYSKNETNYFSLLECEKCNKRKCIYTTSGMPYLFSQIAYDWVDGFCDTETFMIVIGKEKLKNLK